MQRPKGNEEISLVGIYWNSMSGKRNSTRKALGRRNSSVCV